jgi:hypothetical protein
MHLLTSIIALSTVLTLTKAVPLVPQPLSYNSELATRTEFGAPQRGRLQRRNPKGGKGGNKNKNGGGKNNNNGKNGGGDEANLLLLLDHCTSFADDNVPVQLSELQEAVKEGLEESFTLKLLLNHCTSFEFGFESYHDAIDDNKDLGGDEYLSPGLADQGVPWNYAYDGEPGVLEPDYEGAFQLGMSENEFWGEIESVDGDVYAIFQKKACIHQTLSGLVPGQRYDISWSHRGRDSNTEQKPNDINFHYGNQKIYDEEVENTDWEEKSGDFTAGDNDEILKICSTNPYGTESTTFVDNIIIKKH